MAERVDIMKDRFNREIDYLRISITDRCNLRCKYCMPTDVPTLPMSDILTYEEILEIVRAAVGLGITKYKVTGGEPFARKGSAGFIAALKAVPGVEKVSVTTNGILLKENLEALSACGVDGVNISLDTLDAERFREITGRDGLGDVLEAIDACVSTGIKTKINAVSFDYDKYSEDLSGLIGLAKDKPVDVRFIEMMPIGFGKDFASYPHDRLLERLRKEYPGLEKDTAKHGEGPAVYYKIPGFMGSIGLISAMHGKFCSCCNRVRLTSTGFLKSCLCFNDGVDLRTPLRNNEEIQGLMEKAIFNKPAAHAFENPRSITEAANMISIGG